MALHHKIAHRYLERLREASSFEAPPAFLRAVLEFLYVTYASHILAKTRSRLNHLRNQSLVSADEMHRNYITFASGDILENIRVGEVQDFHLSSDVFMRIEGGDQGLYYRILPKKDRRGPFSPDEIRDILYTHVTKHYHALKNLEVSPLNFVDLALLEKECLKYTQRAREYKSAVKMHMPVSLTGWKYIRGMGDAQETLNSHWNHGILVIMDFKGHTHRSGLWHPTKLQLEVDMPEDALSLSQFRDNMTEMTRLAKHESQHVGQSALSFLKTLKENAGLPSHSVRSPKQEQEHALLDIEFHTRLQEEVDWAIRMLPRVQQKDRRDMLRLWTGDLKDTRHLTMYTMAKPRPFFEINKRKNFPKWKSAVRDYISIVLQRVPVGR